MCEHCYSVHLDQVVNGLRNGETKLHSNDHEFEEIEKCSCLKCNGLFGNYLKCQPKDTTNNKNLPEFKPDNKNDLIVEVNDNYLEKLSHGKGK